MPASERSSPPSSSRGASSHGSTRAPAAGSQADSGAESGDRQAVAVRRQPDGCAFDPRQGDDDQQTGDELGGGSARCEVGAEQAHAQVGPGLGAESEGLSAACSQHEADDAAGGSAVRTSDEEVDAVGEGDAEGVGGRSVAVQRASAHRGRGRRLLPDAQDRPDRVRRGGQQREPARPDGADGVAEQSDRVDPRRRAARRIGQAKQHPDGVAHAAEGVEQSRGGIDDRLRCDTGQGVAICEVETGVGRGADHGVECRQDEQRSPVGVQGEPALERPDGDLQPVGAGDGPEQGTAPAGAHVGERRQRGDGDRRPAGEVDGHEVGREGQRRPRGSRHLDRHARGDDRQPGRSGHGRDVDDGGHAADGHPNACRIAGAGDAAAEQRRQVAEPRLARGSGEALGPPRGQGPRTAGDDIGDRQLGHAVSVDEPQDAGQAAGGVGGGQRIGGGVEEPEHEVEEGVVELVDAIRLDDDVTRRGGARQPETAQGQAHRRVGTPCRDLRRDLGSRQRDRAGVGRGRQVQAERDLHGRAVLSKQQRVGRSGREQWHVRLGIQADPAGAGVTVTRTPSPTCTTGRESSSTTDTATGSFSKSGSHVRPAASCVISEPPSRSSAVSSSASR